jgi:hypothetical protein
MSLKATLFAFLLPLASQGQTYSSVIADSTILNFMIWEMDHGETYAEGAIAHGKKKTSNQLLTFDTLNFYFPDSLQPVGWEYHEYLFNKHNGIDSLFTSTDMDSLFIQFMAIKDTVWSHHIEGARIKNWRSPRNQYRYSVPLFCQNQRYVLIKKSFYCGNVCAYGGIYLYEKIGVRKWKLLKVLNGWMS